MRETMTISTANAWYLKGVPDAALLKLSTEPYGERILKALELLAEIEAKISEQEESLWKAPNDFRDLESGDDVLALKKDTGEFVLLRFFKKGDKLDHRFPLINVPDTPDNNRLLGIVFRDGFSDYERFAPQSGFYEYGPETHGYYFRRPALSLYGWVHLPPKPLGVGDKKKEEE